MRFSTGLLALAIGATFAVPAFAQDKADDKATTGGSVSAGEVKPGSQAPDFKLKDADGKEHSLADHKGKVVVLEWTNPGCPFVQRHAKAGTTNKLKAKYPGDEVVFLQVDSTKSVTPESAKKAIDETKLEVAVLLDPDGTVGKQYGAKTTPHLFVIDKEGKVAYMGAYDDDPSGDNASGAKNYVDLALAKVTKGEKVDVAQTKSYGCGIKYKD